VTQPDETPRNDHPIKRQGDPLQDAVDDATDREEPDEEE